MLGIDSSVMVHRLNVSPSFPPICQKKRVFAQERDRVIAEEVYYEKTSFIISQSLFYYKVMLFGL